MNYPETIAKQMGVRSSQVSATIELLDAGNTIPFIARYRKEVTGELDEEQLRTIEDSIEKMRTMDERRQTIVKSIEEQGKMTPELQALITAAQTRLELEDLYAPYKPKRRTRASIARERGLQPLADMIFQQIRTKQTLEQIAEPFINENVPGVDDAWAGARDILAEMISDHADVRRITRAKAIEWGTLSSEKIDDAQDASHTYETYYEFEGRVERLRPHQVLAINRGETEKVLRVKIEVMERDWKTAIAFAFRPAVGSPLAAQLELAANEAAERLLLPSIERDVRRALSEEAEKHAISVFAENLRALLSQPPLANHTVLGIDPGFRTGSKIAVVDATGKLLETTTIYPHEPQNRWQEALKTLNRLIEQHKVTLISIGNGTASRETEQLAAEITRQRPEINYLITNEAGASVYSASPLARTEFPELDVSLRGAVSIARRVQDPLAELVKIDPRSIGVGMYQHDVDQKELTHSLDGVVESVVNNVGVDLNTASPALLTHVAGIGPRLAEQVVLHRNENGPFSDRTSLKKVSGLGAKAFEQAAGFLRIRNARNLLDSSAIHPESYPVAETVLKKAGIDAKKSPAERQEALEALRQSAPVEKLAAELGCGAPTLQDILDQLARPGRDPREDVPLPILRSDVLKMEDLASGMSLKGTVRNVVDFGAFVDIGVKQDGLLHRSQIPRNAQIKVGDIVDVIIQKVEAERGRISLEWDAAK